jgi:hypothetical protein
MFPPKFHCELNPIEMVCTCDTSTDQKCWYWGWAVCKEKQHWGNQSESHDGHQCLDEPCSPSCWGCQSLSPKCYDFDTKSINSQVIQVQASSSKTY